MEFNAFDKSNFSPSKITNLKYRLATKLIYKPAVTRLNVPIIAVTGTNGKTTVTRLLEKVYLDAGYNVGTCTTDGVSHNGTLILNGDDADVRRMVDRSPASPIYFVTGNGHEEFENVFFLKGMSIYKKITGIEKRIIDVKDLPITFNGLLDYNIANVMAALAAWQGMKKFIGVKKESVLKTLKEFGTSPYDNINRFCLLTFNGETVLLGRSKNPESYRREIAVIKKIKEGMGFDKIVGVLSSIGNRQENFLREISALVASGCDYFFIRPPKSRYLRGRNGEEIVRLLSSHIPKHKILSERRSSLNDVISLSRMRLEGKILFVVFCTKWEADIDYTQVVEQGERFQHDFNVFRG